MKCSHCNVEIRGKADFCPLCKQPLNKENVDFGQAPCDNIHKNLSVANDSVNQERLSVDKDNTNQEHLAVDKDSVNQEHLYVANDSANQEDLAVDKDSVNQNSISVIDNINQENRAVSIDSIKQEKLIECKDNNANLDYIYPIKKKRDKKYKMLTFTPMYLLVASIVFLIVTLVNVLIAPEMQWFWVVGVVLIYAYILVSNTIMARSTIAHKILWQALVIFAFIWSLSHILFQMEVIEEVWFWSVDIALPIVIGVSNFVMSILTACFVKRDKSLIIDCIMFSFTGFLPIILYWSGVIMQGHGAIFVAVLSLVQIIVLIIAGRKYLRKQSKLKYRV